MSVEQSEKVDLMSVDSSNGHVILTISDHLDWSNTWEHQQVLQRKFNAYLAFVESGELIERYPDAKGRPVTFEVVLKYEPDYEGRSFFNSARRVIESAGFFLRDRVMS